MRFIRDILILIAFIWLFMFILITEDKMSYKAGEIHYCVEMVDGSKIYCYNAFYSSHYNYNTDQYDKDQILVVEQAVGVYPDNDIVSAYYSPNQFVRFYKVK